jgi:hypothetical protein
MESKKDIDITETVDSSEKHAGNSRAQEGSSVEKAGQDVMDNDETTDEQSREDLHDVSVDEEGRVVAAVREVLASEPNLGVKTILKRIREKFPEVEVDSGQVRAAMQTIAPKRTCAQCNSSKAPFKCTSCNAEYYCSKSCQNLHWKIHKKVLSPRNMETSYPTALLLVTPFVHANAFIQRFAKRKADRPTVG